MDDLDRALCRAYELFLEDRSDAGEDEIATLLPALTAAGYTEEETLPNGIEVWGFTTAGVARAEELGCP
jgi:hypothetical protein